MSNQTIKNHSLFREKALHHLNNQHGLNPVMLKIDSYGWLGLMIVFVLMTAIIIWSIYGEISITIRSQGIILTTNELTKIDHYLQKNWYEQNKRLSNLAELLKYKRKLFQKHMLTLNDIEKAQDEYDEVKHHLRSAILNNELSFSPYVFKEQQDDFSKRAAVIFLDPHIAPQVMRGMPVFLLPTIYSAYQHGYIRGYVSEISTYPVSRDLALLYLGNQDLAASFFKEDAPYMAIITLENKPASTELVWTSKKGAPKKILSGTLISAEIAIKRCSLMQIITKQCEPFK